jgi:hypothetical protein
MANKGRTGKNDNVQNLGVYGKGCQTEEPETWAAERNSKLARNGAITGSLRLVQSRGVYVVGAGFFSGLECRRIMQWCRTGSRTTGRARCTTGGRSRGHGAVVVVMVGSTDDERGAIQIGGELTTGGEKGGRGGGHKVGDGGPAQVRRGWIGGYTGR